MTLNEITTAMQAYSALRTQANANNMKMLFKNKNAFPYNRDTTNPDNGYVHVYPGVDVNGNLVFFVISAYKDVSTNSNIANDVQVCTPIWLDPGNSSTTPPVGAMPTQTALNYINWWIGNYQPWIVNNVGTTNSIFQAFAVPQVDSSYGNAHNAILGLKQNSNAAGVPADIVVQDVDSSSIVYYDNALPVPPFGSGDTAPAAFYLLTLS